MTNEERECDYCGEMAEDHYCNECVDQRIHYAYENARAALIRAGVDPDDAGLADEYRVPEMAEAQAALSEVERLRPAMKSLQDRYDSLRKAVMTYEQNPTGFHFERLQTTRKRLDEQAEQTD